MKKWNEKAEEIFKRLNYKESDLYCFMSGFISGVFCERIELGRWKDPDDELPRPDVEVLMVNPYMDSEYDIMKHNDHGWWMKAPGGGWCAPKYAPIAWRYIEF